MVDFITVVNGWLNHLINVSLMESGRIRYHFFLHVSQHEAIASFFEVFLTKTKTKTTLQI
jgi:hypothetical protein